MDTAAEIVVGIDFGTTFSGVSWAVNSGNKIVRLINDWNSEASNSNSDKVRSTISYQDGKPYHWGYGVEHTGQSFEWFKILLDSTYSNKFGVKSERVLRSKLLLQQMGKTIEEVVADYLYLLWQYTMSDIQRVKGDNWKSIYSLKVVLTVPAIWSPSSKDKTIKVAKRAGLPDNILLVTEPEAAALAVLKDKNEERDNLEEGDAFVVCDAGGGTVDLISYKIKSTRPLDIEECAIGDGGLCGSTSLDIAFENHIKTIVGDEEYEKIKPKSKRRMLEEFERLKRSYIGEEKDYSVDLRGVQDNEDMGIDDDTIKLKASMLKTIFDYVIGQIVRLVDKQIGWIRDRGLKLRAILLVGGFGANKYMHQSLCDAHEGSGVQVLQVNGAWSSICRGATLWGLETAADRAPQTISARLARHSYGIRSATSFDASLHLEMDRYMSKHGHWMADNQMAWLLRKGDKIEQGKIVSKDLCHTVQVSFWDSGVRTFTDPLYYCASDVPPSRQAEDVEMLCNVEYGVDCDALWHESSYKDPTDRQKYRDATFRFSITLDTAELQYKICYKGINVAYTKAKYKDEE